ncbi:MAG: hypothetical protein HKN28_02355 [Alphaproteobacteria bacterium]|nr:hypothetical protein [Alphaproteobacteria bacterium]
MAKKKKNVPAVSSTADTRFNATKHGILSRYTVMPWEDAGEYRELHDGLVAEYGPSGPTEVHLVEELAGIMWRKQRLRMAEAGAAREALDRAVSELGRSDNSSFLDTNIDDDEDVEFKEAHLSLVSVPPEQAGANLERIRGQLSQREDEIWSELDNQEELLSHYREVHEAAQASVANSPNLEKIARYETHLDRKFERTLTMLLRMQEFRKNAVTIDPG